MKIIKIDTQDELLAVQELFLEYATTLGFNLEFQNFEKEVRSLPGEYAEPNGCILLAKRYDEIVGCIALRPMDETVCEMKRMYIRPAHRGKGLGRALATAIIQEAIEKGYQYMRLDTINTMTEAIQLYYSLGFDDIAAYRYNPVSGAKYMELDLLEYNNLTKSSR
jgi:ribosomal protein S18 acetylase RimI-like enzyme